MIKSKYFWFGAIATATIPLLAIDIIQHNIDWQKEVKEQLITVVHNLYSFDKQQKANIIDKILERNQTLMFLIYVKSIAILILTTLSFYFFSVYNKQLSPKLLKPLFYTLVTIAFFTFSKVFLINKINWNKEVKILTIKPNSLSFKELYNENFRGKVVYVDFWGTTCGPCLQEFRDFTKPLKDKYKQRDDIRYLYVGQGNEYLWHQQINKYNVTGDHIFMSEKEYEKLYQLTTNDSLVAMPHYLIIDKKGDIAESDAKRPSAGDSLYFQLNKYLSEK